MSKAALNLSIYIAAPFQLRQQAIFLMTALEQLGFTVTASWLRVQDMPDCDASARMDLADVDRAHVLLALNPADWGTVGTGGRHVELGYAIAKGKQVILLGARSNVFHHLATVHHITELAELQPLLERLDIAA